MEEKKSNKFLLGIIGAVIGAFVGTIPWVLMYVYGGMIVAILSVLIAIASYQGYKITKATIDKKLPVIVAISSVLAVTVATFLIIPMALLAKEGLGANFENLEFIYEDSEFTSAIIGDYIVSLIFTVVGISGIIANLHKQIKAGATREEIKIDLSNPQQVVQPEEMQAVKDIFVKNDALSKNNIITKDDVIQDLSTQIPENRAKEVFNLVKARQIIRKSGGGYYFSEKAENSNFYRNRKSLIAVVIAVIIIIVVVIVAIVATMDDGTSSSKSKSSYSSNNTVNVDVNKINDISNTTNDTNTDEQYEKEHIIDAVGIKFVPTDDLLLLTDEEIELYYGSSYNAYEFIAMDLEGTKIMYCFIDEDESIKDYTAKEYLEETLDASEYDEIKTIKIAGFEFQTTTLSFEQNGKKYLEDCYVYKVDDKFVCFDYCYLEGEINNFDKMITKE